MVRLRPRHLCTQPVIASVAEIHGEHLVLLDSSGRLAGLFLIDVVESWSELPLSRGEI